MSVQTQVNLGGTLGGRRYEGIVLSPAFGVETNVPEITLPAAKPGALTTRTDNNTGVLTMDAGHGLATGRIDVYWDVAGVRGCRRQMDGVVTVDSIAIDGGYGDNLPPDESPITAVAPVSEVVALDADALKIFAASVNKDSHCSISFGTQGTAYAEGGAIELNDGLFGQGRFWVDGAFGTNPLADANNFDRIYASQGGTSAALLNISLGGQ